MDNLSSILFAGVLVTVPIAGIIGIDYYVTKKENERVTRFTDNCNEELKKYTGKKISNIRFDPSTEEFVVLTNDSIGVQLENNSGIETAIRSASKKYLKGKRYYNVDYSAINGVLTDNSSTNNRINELENEMRELRSSISSLQRRMNSVEFHTVFGN